MPRLINTRRGLGASDHLLQPKSAVRKPHSSVVGRKLLCFQVEISNSANRVAPKGGQHQIGHVNGPVRLARRLPLLEDSTRVSRLIGLGPGAWQP
jgi:hypothetical protein